VEAEKERFMSTEDSGKQGSGASRRQFVQMSTLGVVAFATAALVACGGGGSAADDDVTSVLQVNVLSALSPLPGAIYTTLSDCVTTNTNIYDDKLNVFLNGGPRTPNAAGLLPNTSYYVQVTDPSGATVLGSSGANRPAVTDANGKFVTCYRLWDIVKQAGDQQGYADTPNNGGEYKVWVSTSQSFVNDSSKTDNFKVRSLNPPPPPPTGGQITISKWYDANTNGKRDPGEADITGWKVDLLGFDPKSTLALFTDLTLESKVAREYTPDQANWLPTNGYLDSDDSITTISSGINILNQITVPLSLVRTNISVSFGNVCVGKGGGLTLGFWSNKNGQALVTSAALQTLRDLNLRNEDGTNFDPATYPALRNWLLNGRAVNMAYMLSVQMAAMELNVLTGKVNAGALVYAPGAISANAAGFISVLGLITDANNSLGTNPVTRAGMDQRDYQRLLKDALDNANNDLNFVQSAPCPFTFTPPVPTVLPTS
jgi:hypothetical protein